MPGFNVADLIENSVLQPPERWAKNLDACEQKVAHKSVTYSVDCVYDKPNGYEGFASLIRNVFNQHHNNHQQPQQHQHLSNIYRSSVEPSTVSTAPHLKSSQTAISSTATEPNSALGNKHSQTINSPSFAELTTDPMAWQRLFYISPELADYFFITSSCGQSRANDAHSDGNCHSATDSSFRSRKPNSPSHVQSNTSDLTVGLNGLNQGIISSSPNEQNQTTPATDLAPWWESQCVADFFAAQTQRALYLDPRNLTMNYCNSMFGSSQKSHLFFPPPADLRKPKRIRTAFSPAQLFQLENTFERNHYVVGQERKDLAAGLGLTETQVKVWFQNRRTKYKRMRMDDPDQSTSACGADPESPDVAGSGNQSEEEDDDEDGLDLSNDRTNQPNSSNSTKMTLGVEQIVSSESLVHTERPVDKADKARDSSCEPKPRFGLELLLHGCKASQRVEDRPSGDADAVVRNHSDWTGPGTGTDYSHRTAYTSSDHLAYATHAVNSHLFGISS